MTDKQHRQKQDAAERAAALVRSRTVVGLGTGSTAELALLAIGERLKAGQIADIVGIPTSRRTEALATRLQIPLSTLDQHPIIDITIDGADEIDPRGNLIKGFGGALLWEKIVASATRHYVIIADETKLVNRLGTRAVVPVEVVPFGWSTHCEIVRKLGGEVTLRLDERQDPYRTDGQHYILDCRFPRGIDDPHGLDRSLRQRPGVVETGLFLDFAPEVIVGRDSSS